MNRGPEKQAIDDDACDACDARDARDAREVRGRSLMISLVSNAYRIAMTKPIHEDLKIDGTIRP